MTIIAIECCELCGAFVQWVYPDKTYLCRNEHCPRHHTPGRGK